MYTRILKTCQFICSPACIYTSISLKTAEDIFLIKFCDAIFLGQIFIKILIHFVKLFVNLVFLAQKQCIFRALIYTSIFFIIQFLFRLQFLFNLVLRRILDPPQLIGGAANLTGEFWYTYTRAKIKTGLFFSTSDESVNLQRNSLKHGYTLTFIQVSQHILIFNQTKVNTLVTKGVR